MLLRRLEHYNIRTIRYPDTVHFYVEVLGLHRDLAILNGNWLYDASGTPAVHLIAVDPNDSQQSYAHASRFRGGMAGLEGQELFFGSGAIDHVAFECTGYHELTGRLRNAQLSFHENAVAGMKLRQVFVKDPNGITLELNFRE